MNGGGRTQSWENLQEKARLGAILWAFPRRKKNLEVLEMPGTPQNQKWTAATIIKQTQKLAKKSNQWQPNIFLFPLTPTKARTTKLAQKLEKHPNQSKPCSTSGLLRGHLFKDIILTFLDPIWLCWKLFKFVPQLCNKADRLCAAAYDYLRVARNRLYRYHFDGNYSIFPYISLSSWNMFFLIQRMPE